MWVLYAFLSAALLGIYDICKKKSVTDNAVMPVLLSTMCFSSLLLLTLMGLTALGWVPADTMPVPRLNMQQHLLVFIKALIILTSGMCTYHGIKHVPLTLAAPIGATRPAWVILGGVLLFGERLSWQGWVAIGIVLCGLMAFSMIGNKEVALKSSPHLWLVIAGMLLGACSGVYDKYILTEVDRTAVQFFYAVEQAAMMAVLVAVLWWPHRRQDTPFHWRWSILGVSLFWVASDYVYFYALSQAGALISVIAVIRRSGTVIPFLYGALRMHDARVKPKAVALGIVLTGVILLACMQ